MADMKKTCTKCGTEKLLTEFYKDKRAKDGACSACKECMKARFRKYRPPAYGWSIGLSKAVKTSKLNNKVRQYGKDVVDSMDWQDGQQEHVKYIDGGFF